MIHLPNGIVSSRKEEVVPTFFDKMDELETVKLSEIIQLVKENYHMISFITGI